MSPFDADLPPRDGLGSLAPGLPTPSLAPADQPMPDATERAALGVLAAAGRHRHE